MGGKSSSKSSSNTSYTTLNTSLEGESPVAIIDSSGVEVQVTDHAAIAEAFNFAENALDTVDESLGFAEDAAARSSAQASKAYESANDLVNEQVGAIKELATSLKLGNSALRNWIVIIGIIAILLGVVAYFIWG